jgi:hypothetical protein
MRSGPSRDAYAIVTNSEIVTPQGHMQNAISQQHPRPLRHNPAVCHLTLTRRQLLYRMAFRHGLKQELITLKDYMWSIEQL